MPIQMELQGGKPPLNDKYKKYIGSEDEFQKRVAAYLDLNNVTWFHPANERKTGIAVNAKGQRFSPEGNKLKAKGVKSGVPDILIFNRCQGFAGLAIELKVGKNTLSAQQIEFMGKLNKQGWLCWVSWSLYEIVDLLDWYFKNEKKF